ncbi:hypothetical protein [Hydrocoleum sp. CS-953]|uniref:hypothetical protein n=1 Tax=Hydrocoleum sp. CS-953 TaxID=1671698 RepID=UPI00143DF32F|nr:hypothetical protein [Hydrocoleum sp. CS-953]
MAKSPGETRGYLSTIENIYLLLVKADIWENSLTNFRLSIYGSEIFTSSEN